ncbi:MAG TPA: ABC transporter ATP-binding protein [Acetobacteraceae bacterium]|jgi:ABC-type Fe3+/spermidine/putrescine transport system ATPase subunit|nr:ABC transporter ATP-binding protein [Acetobacteraceae bacterium]
MSAEAIGVDGLTVAYGAAPVVDGIAFAVARGEHVTLLGPSACGKTSTLRAIAGLERPVAGRIRIGGAPVFDAAMRRDVPPERRRISMVFQSYAIWPHMTVFDNVAYGLRARRAPRATIEPAVGRALALVGLHDLATRSAARLSGGQQQRVALARAIAANPEVVLLDEPLSNLDAQLRITMRTELADLRRRLGFTAIYVTHDQEEAFALSDRIVIMRAGRIEQEGSPETLHAMPRTQFVARFLGMRNVIAGSARPLHCTARAAEIRLPDGTVLRAVDNWPGPGWTGAEPAACFRPLDVSLFSEPASGQGADGVVVQRLFLGDLVQVTLRCNGYDVIAANRPRGDLIEGARLHWRVAPERCLVTWS